VHDARVKDQDQVRVPDLAAYAYWVVVDAHVGDHRGSPALGAIKWAGGGVLPVTDGGKGEEPCCSDPSLPSPGVNADLIHRASPRTRTLPPVSCRARTPRYRRR